MKKKIFLAVLYMVSSFLPLLAVAFLAEYGVISAMSATILVVLCLVPFWFSALYISKVDIAIHIFRCRNCGHGFKPTAKEYMWGAHTLRKRYLRCPKCGEKTWCLVEKAE